MLVQFAATASIVKPRCISSVQPVEAKTSLDGVLQPSFLLVYTLRITGLLGTAGMATSGTTNCSVLQSLSQSTFQPNSDIAGIGVSTPSK